MGFESANPHLVQSLSRLSEKREVSAAEDIFDDRGRKLWAKGNRVSHDLQERLLQRKLARPLETTLTVENALSFSDIQRACEKLAGETAALGRLSGAGTLGILRRLERFPLPAPVRLLLTSAQVEDSPTWRHTITSVLVAAGLAHRSGATDHDAETLAVAALLHDLGEMYINPDYLRGAGRLEPHEWKHVASHPKVGEMLIRTLTTLPNAVAQIVGEHHERLDGSGYPAQTARATQHRLSNWLAIADTTSAILAGRDPGGPERVALALKIVPEEFDREAVAAVIRNLRDGSGASAIGGGDCSCVGRVQHAWRQVRAAIAETDRLEEGRPTSAVTGIITLTRNALLNLDKSLRATGVVEMEQLGRDIEDPALLGEICLVAREAGWRLRNLARNIHLRGENQLRRADEMSVLESLIAILNEAGPAPYSCQKQPDPEPPTQ